MATRKTARSRRPAARKTSARKPPARKAAAKKTGSRNKPAKSRGKRAAPKIRGRSVARRPIWTGHLRLALVSVPVQILPATVSGARISFHQVHKPSGKRVRYEKVVPGIGPVDTDEIFKGFETSKGHYVLLEEEELDAVRVEARKTLDLVQFVDHCEIEPIWFERPYYVVPDGDLAEEAYRVIRDALRETRKVGIGQFVMRGREYIAALKPCGYGMLLETMRFADEVRGAAPLFADIGRGKSDPEMKDLARSLIEKKTAPFDAKVFKDRYTEALRDAIETKARTKKPIEVSEEEAPGGAEVIDLVEALKRSVKGSGGKAGAAQSRRRKAG